MFVSLSVPIPVLPSIYITLFFPLPLFPSTYPLGVNFSKPPVLLMCPQNFTLSDSKYDLQSDLEWNIAAISGLVPPNSLFQTLTEFKGFYIALWARSYFPPDSHFPQSRNTASRLPFYRYFHRKWSDDLHSRVTPVQTFTNSLCRYRNECQILQDLSPYNVSQNVQLSFSDPKYECPFRSYID